MITVDLGGIVSMVDHGATVEILKAAQQDIPLQVSMVRSTGLLQLRILMVVYPAHGQFQEHLGEAFHQVSPL